MNKLAQIDFGQLGSQIAGAAGDVGGKLSGWWKAIPDEAKKNLLRGTVGAGTGALLAHTLAGGFSDKEYRPGMAPALLGALLGGGAAVAAPVGMRMLSGDIKFAPKTSKPIVDRAADATIGGVAAHPGATAGAVGAGIVGKRMLPTYANMNRAVKDTAIGKQLAALLQKKDVMNYGPLNPGRAAGMTLVDKLKALKNVKGSLKNIGQYAIGSNVPQNVAKARQLAGVVRNPLGVLALMAALPAAGHLADRYAFGRHG